MPATASQFNATAAHHEKMARIYRQIGRAKDAEAAEKAAKLCRQNAPKA